MKRIEKIEGIEKIERIEVNQKQNDDVLGWGKSTPRMSPQHDCFPVSRAPCTLVDAGKLSSGLSMHVTLFKLATGIQFRDSGKTIQAPDSNPDSDKPRSSIRGQFPHTNPHGTDSGETRHRFGDMSHSMLIRGVRLLTPSYLDLFG